jgi:hypothetical protein
MSTPPDTLIGCLLDVSGSMSHAFGSKSVPEDAVDRLQAVFGAALQIAEAEKRQDSRSLMFVAAFGLREDCPPVVDLCKIAEILLAEHGNGPSGHDLLVGLANGRELTHVADFIEERLTETEARVVYNYLRQHPEQIEEFINVIPSPAVINAVRRSSVVLDRRSSITSQQSGFLSLLSIITGIDKASEKVDEKIENSKSLRLARTICTRWLRSYQAISAYPVDRVVDILGRVYQQFRQPESGHGVSTEATNVVNTLKRYIYGATPMQAALKLALTVFQDYALAQRRMLVLISDGASTDGDPQPAAHDLHSLGVILATVYVTNDEKIAGRRLYDRKLKNWTKRQSTLFEMASKVPSVAHPIPVLKSKGWDVPISGECALYAVVSCTTALHTFCSVLLSGNFGSTRSLLDTIGCVAVDSYVNGNHVGVLNKPSDQGRTMTCYAHATAAAIHMALARIVARKEGHPTIPDIRDRILRDFPTARGIHDFGAMLKIVLEWYRPLQYRQIDEIGARNAVLHRRPVLSAFALSKAGWIQFSDHFKSSETCDKVLTLNEMMPHRNLPAEGAHAVVMTGCSPTSITFLNSWGDKWGQHGSFSVENHKVLEVKKARDKDRMCFYDIFWLQSSLHQTELDAYDRHNEQLLRDYARDYPSLVTLTAQCPLCEASEPVSRFGANVSEATCPQCHRSFELEPVHMLRALHDRPGSPALG